MQDRHIAYMLTTSSIFARYVEIRPRLPIASVAGSVHEIGSLMDIADQALAFLLMPLAFSMSEKS